MSLVIGIGCAIRLTVALVLVTVADQREQWQCLHPSPAALDRSLKSQQN
jgi:hypothetical protein